MAWQANVTIHNNTNYGLEIGGVGAGNTSIGPNSSTNWSSQDVNNTKSLYFPSSVAPVYMQGNLSFGPEAGVYVDRGWMESGGQLITMTAEAIIMRCGKSKSLRLRFNKNEYCNSFFKLVL